MRSATRVFLGLCTLVLMGGCGPRGDDEATSAARRPVAADSANAPEVDASGSAAMSPPPSSPPVTPGAQPVAPSAWTASPRGVGPVLIGMSMSQLRSVLDPNLRIPDVMDPACGYVSDSNHAGVLIMIVDGRVARVDVDSTTVPTTEGARVGDSATRIQDLYGPGIDVRPHKYTEGQYLVVAPTEVNGDSTVIVFETSPDGIVTRYRTGRLPEVEWVEGCS